MGEAFELNDDLLKEVFALLTSSTNYEVELAYDAKNPDYWKNEDLTEDFDVTQPKREFALDALRGVLNWLHRHQFQLMQDGKEVDMKKVLDQLIQSSDEEEPEEQNSESQA